MTRHDIGWMLSTTNLQAIRMRCGIRQATIASALGIAQGQICQWENRRKIPAGVAGSRYVRIMAALREHDDITRQLAAEEAGTT